jgi:hypothetical protein
MSNVENLEDHMAYACKCGSVHFNLLKSSFIECSGCGLKLEQFWGSKQNKIEQQPIAWRWGAPKLKNGDFEWRYSLNQTRPDAIPLYATPPQRKPLTDEEIMNIAKVSCIGISPQEDTLNFAKVIEAAHGIKGEA